MPNPNFIGLEIGIGPATRAALDVMDYAKEIFVLIPEWHVDERKELNERARALYELLMSGVLSST